MLQLERQKLILEYLKQNRKATTNELSEMLGVSTTTIRTDLNQMDKEKTSDQNTWRRTLPR